MEAHIQQAGLVQTVFLIVWETLKKKQISDWNLLGFVDVFIFQTFILKLISIFQYIYFSIPNFEYQKGWRGNMVENTSYEKEVRGTFEPRMQVDT